jgi:hypothetical protein
METQEDYEIARERLRRRDGDELVSFLISLAGDAGPVGEQVRTFIVGDSVEETVDSIRCRITGLKGPSEYEHRHSLGREMGVQLNFIVDSIERLILPIDPSGAFELLAALIEADGVAMENCGEHEGAVASAYERAARVMAQAANSMPRTVVENRLKSLTDGDAYGIRAGLASVVLKVAPIAKQSSREGVAVRNSE